VTILRAASRLQWAPAAETFGLKQQLSQAAKVNESQRALKSV
jgi:hypothetical protein